MAPFVLYSIKLTNSLFLSVNCSVRASLSLFGQFSSCLSRVAIPFFNIGKISAQPHTIVKQICFPSGNILFLSLFALSKN